MNIFIVDDDPFVAAQMLCDKHIVKMPLESCQTLCAPFDNGVAPYKRTHYNHGCTKWVRESYENYEWLINHAQELLNEYSRRYNNRVHKCQAVLNWVKNNYLSYLNLPDVGLTPFYLAMGNEFKVNNNPVDCYRNFYIKAKSEFAEWRCGNVPFWYTDGLTKVKNVV